MPVEERALIFERFARGATAGRRSGSEGAGLGLALVDEHVRMHGGRVWVEDRLDGEPGARFVIELLTVEVETDGVDATPLVRRCRCSRPRVARARRGVRDPAGRRPRDIPADDTHASSSRSTPMRRRSRRDPAGSSSSPTRTSDGQRHAALGRCATSIRRSPEAVLDELFEGPNAEEFEAGFDSAAARRRSTLHSARRGRRDAERRRLAGDPRAAAARRCSSPSPRSCSRPSELDGVRTVRLPVDGEPQAWPDGRGELQTEPLTVYDFPGLAESTQPAFPAIPSPVA